MPRQNHSEAAPKWRPRRFDRNANVGLKTGSAQAKPSALRCSAQASGSRVSAISFVADSAAG